MPFHVVCLKCGHKMAKGVRFNSNQYKVGKYLSTDLLKFTMTCWECKNLIVIETDPENTEYVVKEGARR